MPVKWLPSEHPTRFLLPVWMKIRGSLFFAKGTLDVQTSCNSGGGSYTTKEDKLTFTDLFFTERACEGERNTREQEFTNALLEINSYSIQRNTLTLEKDEEVWVTLQLQE